MEAESTSSNPAVCLGFLESLGLVKYIPNL
jgi:hypothetical protein